MDKLETIGENQQNFILSIALYADDLGNLNNFLKNIEQDQVFQDEKAQIIVLDHLNNEESKNILSSKKEAYPSCYQIKECQDMSAPEAFNSVINELRGEYICFTKTDYKFAPGSLDEVSAEKIKSKRIVSLHPLLKKSERYPKLKKYRNTRCKINLLTYMCQQSFTLAFGSCFFSRDFVTPDCFDERLTDDYGMKFLLSCYEITSKYILLKHYSYYRGVIESDYYNFPPRYSREWYFDSLKYFMIPMMEKTQPLYIQFAVMYLLQCRYACNLNARDSEVLNDEQYHEFLKLSSEVMKNMDDYVVSKMNIGGFKRLPKHMALTMLRIKYMDPNLVPDVIKSPVNLTTAYNNVALNSISTENLRINAIYFDGKNLLIDGVYEGGMWLSGVPVKLMACINGEFADVRLTQTYGLTKVFNHSYAKNMSFQFSWESKSISNNVKFSFYLIYGENAYKLKIVFARYQSKLAIGFNHAYWIFDKKMLTFDKKKQEFCISNYTKKELFKRERNLLKDFKKAGPKDYRKKAIRLRLLYWLTRGLFKKKHIWMTQDKLFKGGDNGEYFFRYVRSLDLKDTDIYYVLNEKAPEYAERKKEFGKYLVKQNSLKHQILALNTDLFLATHVDVMLCNGFSSNFRPFFKDLFNGRVVCLAHGLTIQKIAQYQNRVFDNTVLYFFASKYEVQNVSHPIYDYYDKNMLKLTGHARYDGLKNNDQKIILITPSWRRSLTVGKTEKGSPYQYNENFKHSTYYHIYNSLIHDEKITAAAKRNGYKIVYLLHPAMSPQLPDFESSDICQVVAATSDISYEKILTESSLMVTDYSGVQFDFAYMKKPIIYYHPDLLPAQYAEGGLVYETMGFGPICKDHDEIVNELCAYMDHQCVMTDEYKRRVDDFFEYDDFNNCERIYKEVADFQNKFEKVNTI